MQFFDTDRISRHGRQHDADREGRESQSPYPSRTGTGFHARSFLFAFRSERPLVEHLREAHEAMEKKSRSTKMTQYKEKSDKNADLHKNQIKSPFVSSIGKIGGFAHGRIRQAKVE